MGLSSRHSRVPVSGILSSTAAFTQAQTTEMRREITLDGHGLDVPRQTDGGPGGGPVWTNTVQSQVADERYLNANGANALRIAPTLFQSNYDGGLLSSSYHELEPSYAVNLRA